MKKKIHPICYNIVANCSCGNIIKIESTVNKDIFLDVCSSCHPYFTGKQRSIDVRGRVEKFSKRFNKIGF